MVDQENHQAEAASAKPEAPVAQEKTFSDEYKDVAVLSVVSKAVRAHRDSDSNPPTTDADMILKNLGGMYDINEQQQGKPSVVRIEMQAGQNIKLPHILIDKDGEETRVTATAQGIRVQKGAVVPITAVVGRSNGMFQCEVYGMKGVHDVPEDQFVTAMLIAKRDKLKGAFEPAQDAVVARYLDSVTGAKGPVPNAGEEGHDVAALQMKEAVDSLPIVSNEDLKDTYADKKRAEIEAAVRRSEEYKQAAQEGDAEGEEFVQAAVAKKVSENAPLARVLELQKKLQEKTHPTAAELTTYVKDVCLIQAEEYTSVEAQIKTLEARLAQQKTADSTADQSELTKQIADLKVRAEYLKTATQVALDNQNQIGSLCQKIQSGELVPQDVSQFREFIADGNLNTLGEVVKNNIPAELQEAVKEEDEKSGGKLSGFLKDNPFMWIALLVGGVSGLVVVSSVMQGSRG